MLTTQKFYDKCRQNCEPDHWEEEENCIHISQLYQMWSYKRTKKINEVDLPIALSALSNYSI